ncbi:MAG: CAP domain-containing protein [Luteolibacter sp.]
MPVSSTIGSDSSLSGQVFQGVNSYRASKGKAALVRHAGLDRLAQQHCDYLVKTRGSYGLHGSDVSHMGYEGRLAIANHKYGMSSISENVVSSSTKSASHLVNLWTGSKGHENNMSGSWSCTGVATAVTPEGTVISTQLFGTDPGVANLEHPNMFNGFR